MPDTENAPISTETDDNPSESTETQETDSDASESDTEAFDAEYVGSLRKESAKYRDRAKTAEARVDALSKQLHSVLVAETGRLQDPRDIAFQAEHLDDPQALTAAIDELLEERPHLAKRKFSDAGQGQRGKATGPKDFSGLFR